jgi:hypothetical protein
MITRRFLLQSSAASGAYLAAGVWPAHAQNAPGVTDKEIKIGQTMPTKDVTDARWKNDPGIKEFQAFCAKYLTPADFIDWNAVAGFTAAGALVQVLKQCGDDLSRDNIMRQATNLMDLELPLLLPGIKVNTSPTNYSPIRQMQLQRFNGESWELFGGVLTGRATERRRSTRPKQGGDRESGVWRCGGARVADRPSGPEAPESALRPKAWFCARNRRSLIALSE